MTTAESPAGSAVYRALRALFGTAARLYFRRIEVRHLERFPREGPVLIVANHPASLTDVLVLGAVMPRAIHFLAFSGLFRPRMLGWLLRGAGAVPVYRRVDAADEMHRNEETFRAVHELLDREGVVLIFPEGTSMTDRRLQPLKTGAARIALAQDERPRARRPMILLPIGLHFVERTAFGSDVVLTIGRPIDLAPFRERAATDGVEAVRGLTDEIQAVIEKLVLIIPSADAAQLVRDVERLYVEELKQRDPSVPDLPLLRGVADCVEHFRETDPPRLYAIWREVTAYQRKLAALDLRDRAVRDSASGPAAPKPSLWWGALGALPALLGVIVHVVPYRLSSLAGHWFAPDAANTAFVRIVAGVILFPITYLGIAWLLHRAGLPLPMLPVTLLLLVALGFFALGYVRWIRRERHRIRFALVAAGNRRMIARLRSDRRRLIALLDEARRDYLAELERRAARSGAG